MKFWGSSPHGNLSAGLKDISCVEFVEDWRLFPQTFIYTIYMFYQNSFLSIIIHKLHIIHNTIKSITYKMILVEDVDD